MLRLYLEGACVGYDTRTPFHLDDRVPPTPRVSGATAARVWLAALQAGERFSRSRRCDLRPALRHALSTLWALDVFLPRLRVATGTDPADPADPAGRNENDALGNGGIWWEAPAHQLLRALRVPDPAATQPGHDTDPADPADRALAALLEAYVARARLYYQLPSPPVARPDLPRPPDPDRPQSLSDPDPSTRGPASVLDPSPAPRPGDTRPEAGRVSEGAAGPPRPNAIHPHHAPAQLSSRRAGEREMAGRLVWCR